MKLSLSVGFALFKKSLKAKSSSVQKSHITLNFFRIAIAIKKTSKKWS
jgi:hypothetical protein